MNDPQHVTAAFESMAAARAAIEQLEQRGVDASRISLLGPAAEAAGGGNLDATRSADEALTDEQVRTFARGAATGAAAGGTAGFLAGLAAFGIPGIGQAVAGGIWALVLGGGGAGAGVGVAASSYQHFKESEAWAETLAAVEDGRVMVGVRGDDPDQLATGAAVLRDASTEPLRFYDRQGQPLEEPARQ